MVQTYKQWWITVVSVVGPQLLPLASDIHGSYSDRGHMKAINSHCHKSAWQVIAEENHSHNM